MFLLFYKQAYTTFLQLTIVPILAGAAILLSLLIEQPTHNWQPL